MFWICYSLLDAYASGSPLENLCVELGRVLKKEKQLCLLDDITALIHQEDLKRFKNEVMIWKLTNTPPTPAHSDEIATHKRVNINLPICYYIKNSHMIR